jgi:hypothetical protein
MTPKHFSPYVAAMLAAGVLAPAAAHHSFSAVYDGSRTLTLDGKITQFHFVNPHALATVDVTDEQGGVQQWTVEFDGRLNLTNGGWSESSIAIGEHVQISGAPERTGARRIFFAKLVRADGSELLRPASNRLNSVEEERRQRALQRTAPTDQK